MTATDSKLHARVVRAAEEALAAQGTASPVDVLTGLRWLEPSSAKRWQQGREDCLEAVIQTAPKRLAEAMRIFHVWANENGLLPREAQYVAATPQRQALHFTHGRDAATEQAYRTHFVSPALPEKTQARLAEKANRPPELLVIQPSKDFTCHRCGGSGGWLIMEDAGPACLRCAGLDDLAFLPSGDALLTRRAKAKSVRSAVVVRFSRSRGRYERQGLLVEPRALADAEREVQDRG